MDIFEGSASRFVSFEKALDILNRITVEDKIYPRLAEKKRRLREFAEVRKWSLKSWREVCVTVGHDDARALEGVWEFKLYPDYVVCIKVCVAEVFVRVEAEGELTYIPNSDGKELTTWRPIHCEVSLKKRDRESKTLAIGKEDDPFFFNWGDSAEIRIQFS